MLQVAVRHAFPGFALEAEFTAPPGVTALFGPSGSGKSTLVDAVAGLLRPQAGRIAAGERVLFDGARGVFLPAWQRRVACVFQDARLFPHLTVRGNLLYGRWFAGTRRASFDQVVGMLDIAPLLSRRPATLSGGERSRVAIGRALLADPQILLMDEPLAALDEARKAEILPYLEQLRDATEIPILYVSHAVPEIARLARAVVMLKAGKVIRQGSVAEVFSDPGAVHDLGLREAGSVIAATVAEHDAYGLTRLTVSGGSLWLPRVEAAPGARLQLRIVAQDVILATRRPEGLSALNILPGVVTALRQGDGPGAMVQVALGQDLLLARITRRSAAELGLAIGSPVHAVLKSVAVAPGDVGRLRQG